MAIMSSAPAILVRAVMFHFLPQKLKGFIIMSALKPMHEGLGIATSRVSAVLHGYM
jgi:hypothetical protein